MGAAGGALGGEEGFIAGSVLVLVQPAAKEFAGRRLLSPLGVLRRDGRHRLCVAVRRVGWRRRQGAGWCAVSPREG